LREKADRGLQPRSRTAGISGQVMKSRNKEVPSGHFYSPIPDLEEVLRDEQRIFGSPPPALNGIELYSEQQLALIEGFASHYQDIPFHEEPARDLRYHYRNASYSYTDAIFLYSMIRLLKPRRVIEIGSGYSSCVTLDTNERFFDNSIECVFVEPYPKKLKALLKPDDAQRLTVIESRVQDIPLETFARLECNDILFVDSTHVSKAGSDVNHILFEILPTLTSGVYIHFHDIFYPFEYPKNWVMQGRAWNECYMLRAFLQYNAAFRIRLFSHYLMTFHRAIVERHLPLCAKNLGGNIWISKG